MLTSGWLWSCSGVSVGEIDGEAGGADDEASVHAVTPSARLATTNIDPALRAADLTP
jgi:hypothetical protein